MGKVLPSECVSSSLKYLIVGDINETKRVCTQGRETKQQNAECLVRYTANFGDIRIVTPFS